MSAHVEPYRRDGKPVRGRWRIVFEGDRDGRGRRHRRVRTVDATGKKDAERQMRQMLTQMDSQDYVEPARITVSDWLETWLSEFAPASCLAQSTIVGYRGVNRRYIEPALGGRRLQHLEAVHVQRLYNSLLDRGLSARTVIQVHAVLHRALDKALELRLVSVNVTDKGRGVARPRIQRRELVALEPQEQVALLTAARGLPMFLPIWLAIYTGMRRSEVLALTWDDVDLERGVLRVQRAWDTGPAAGSHSHPEDRYRLKPPKSEHGRRVIELDASTAALLRNTRREQDAFWAAHGIAPLEECTRRDGEILHWGRLVVARPDGTPWWPDAFSAKWQAFRKQTGTRATYHDLRRTHGSNLLMAGANPKVVQQRLGHHSAAFTLDVYTTVLAGMEREAASKAADFVGFQLEATAAI